MKHTAFKAEEYDKKIRQTLPYYKDFYKQILDILSVMGKNDAVWLDISKNRFQKAGNRFEQTAVQVNHYLSEKDRESAVKNCDQALKKGGIFFSFENIAPNSEKGKQIVLQRWQNYQIANGKDPAEADAHIRRYGTEYFPITVNAHFETMQKGGFQNVELIWMSYMQAGFMGIKE